MTVTQHDITLELDAPPEVVQELLVEGDRVALRSDDPLVVPLKRTAKADNMITTTDAALQGS